MLVAVADNNRTDSIYGLATPLGRSAISVIRVSGASLPVGFMSSLSLSNRPNTRFVKTIKFKELSDQCLILYFKSPNSYTGENIVEIHCHGNPVIVTEIFEWLEDFGIREAEPGEFSKRAYLNERITLDQAEAISFGIEAGSLKDLASMDAFRSGKLAKKIEKILKACEGMLIVLESQLDFSEEEDVDEVKKEEIIIGLRKISTDLNEILKNYRPITKKQLKPKIVLAGKPNVGKSTLFNYLVGDNVAIVSDEPGTTRDVVRGDLYLDGVEVEIGDTAGIRKTPSEVERAGIEKTTSAVEEANVVIWVSDLSDLEVSRPRCEIWVGNKLDKTNKTSSFICDLLISAKTGEGVDLLINEVKKRVKIDDSYHLVSERIYKKVSNSAEIIAQSLGGDDFYEKAAQDLRDVLVLIKDIYGDFSNEKILDEIFQNFCIGK